MHRILQLCTIVSPRTYAKQSGHSGSTTIQEMLNAVPGIYIAGNSTVLVTEWNIHFAYKNVCISALSAVHSGENNDLATRLHRIYVGHRQKAWLDRSINKEEVFAFCLPIFHSDCHSRTSTDITAVLMHALDRDTFLLNTSPDEVPTAGCSQDTHRRLYLP